MHGRVLSPVGACRADYGDLETRPLDHYWPSQHPQDIGRVSELPRRLQFVQACIRHTDRGQNFRSVFTQHWRRTKVPDPCPRELDRVRNLRYGHAHPMLHRKHHAATDDMGVREGLCNSVDRSRRHPCFFKCHQPLTQAFCTKALFDLLYQAIAICKSGAICCKPGVDTNVWH